MTAVAGYLIAAQFGGGLNQWRQGRRHNFHHSTNTHAAANTCRPGLPAEQTQNRMREPRAVRFCVCSAGART